MSVMCTSLVFFKSIWHSKSCPLHALLGFHPYKSSNLFKNNVYIVFTHKLWNSEKEYCISLIRRRGVYLVYHVIYCGDYSRAATNRGGRLLD